MFNIQFLFFSFRFFGCSNKIFQGKHCRLPLLLWERVEVRGRLPYTAVINDERNEAACYYA